METAFAVLWRRKRGVFEKGASRRNVGDKFGGRAAARDSDRLFLGVEVSTSLRGPFL